ALQSCDWLLCDGFGMRLAGLALGQPLRDNVNGTDLFPALCAWGCVLITYAMGRRFHGEKTGIYAAAVFQTCLLPFAVGRINILDMPLTFFTVSAIWLGFRYYDAQERKDTEKRRSGESYLYGFYFCIALAVLTKGLIGILFPVAIVVLWLFWMGRWREVWRLASPGGILLFAVVAVPWFVMVQRENPDFFRFFFIHEHFLRYTTTVHQRTEPFYYFGLIILAGTTPWGAFLPWCLGAGEGVLREMNQGERRFFVLWIVTIVAFFSLSSSKLAPYIMPVFPPLAVLMGHIIRRGEEGMAGVLFKSPARLAWWRLPVFIQGLTLAAAVFVPFFVEEYRRLGHPAWPFLVFPFLLSVVIPFLPELTGRRFRRGWFTPTWLLVAAYLNLLIVPVGHYLTPGKSAYDVARAAAVHLPAKETLYQYRLTMYGIDFYNASTTAIVADPGELGYGLKYWDDEARKTLFPTRDEFF
ncbi:MAG: glycosyltransferase family 39 protein, partial [Syntrophales bacterium]|nr:glycosyltransferase family 39 protein [Syntrophales bacterium]